MAHELKIEEVLMTCCRMTSNCQVVYTNHLGGRNSDRQNDVTIIDIPNQNFFFSSFFPFYVYSGIQDLQSGNKFFYIYTNFQSLLNIRSIRKRITQMSVAMGLKININTVWAIMKIFKTTRALMKLCEASVCISSSRGTQVFPHTQTLFTFCIKMRNR